jgi:hypothetical protein
MAMETPPMGLINLQQRARQGDPQAIQMLQALMGGGQPPMAPPQGGMSQAQFSGGGQPIPADIQARRAKQLIEMLRARDKGMGMMEQGY